MTLAEVFTEEVRAARVARVMQWVEDFSPKPLDELRVLDLGCGDAGFSIALAERGAEVVGIEGREHNLTPALPVVERLSNLTLIHGDVRDLSDADRFDVVLCLGLLYHLTAAEVFEFVPKLAAVCSRLALIETQVSLKPKLVVNHDGRDFWGADYPENNAQSGASLDEPWSFWPTRPSLLNMLSMVGFRSVAELLNPTVPVVAAFADHVALAAVKQP